MEVNRSVPPQVTLRLFSFYKPMENDLDIFLWDFEKTTDCNWKNRTLKEGDPRDRLGYGKWGKEFAQCGRPAIEQCVHLPLFPACPEEGSEESLSYDIVMPFPKAFVSSRKYSDWRDFGKAKGGEKRLWGLREVISDSGEDVTSPRPNDKSDVGYRQTGDVDPNQSPGNFLMSMVYGRRWRSSGPQGQKLTSEMLQPGAPSAPIENFELGEDSGATQKSNIGADDTLNLRAKNYIKAAGEHIKGVCSSCSRAEKIGRARALVEDTKTRNPIWMTNAILRIVGEDVLDSEFVGEREKLTAGEIYSWLLTLGLLMLGWFVLVGAGFVSGCCGGEDDCEGENCGGEDGGL